MASNLTVSRRKTFFFLDHSPFLGTDDLFRVRILFLFFVFDIYRCKIFFRIIRHERVFFSEGIFSPRCFRPRIIFLRNQSVGYNYFFWNHPYSPPLKSQIVGLLGLTLGARDFSSAVSGFCQVFIVTRAKSFATCGLGLRPKMCRPSANPENSHRTRKKPLVPRVLRASSWKNVCV